MKTFILTLTGSIFILTAHAQYNKGEAAATAPAKAVYFELGGPGLASINYDMRFTNSEKGIGGRIGIGGFSVNSGSTGTTITDRTTVIFIPLGINYLIGSDGRHYLELGGGITPVIVNDTYSGGSDKFTSTFGHLNIGYRMQPKEAGFFFRAAINPVFGKGLFWPYYGGVAFGYKF